MQNLVIFILIMFFVIFCFFVGVVYWLFKDGIEKQATKTQQLDTGDSRKIKNGKKQNKTTDLLPSPEEISFWKEIEGKTYKDFKWNGEILGIEWDFEFNIVSMSYQKPIIAYKANLYQQKCTCPNFVHEKSRNKKNTSKRMCKHLLFLFAKLEEGVLERERQVS